MLRLAVGSPQRDRESHLAVPHMQAREHPPQQDVGSRNQRDLSPLVGPGPSAASGEGVLLQLPVPTENASVV